MTKQQFKNLKKGDRVYYNLAIVTVKRWLDYEYMVEYENGTNTKISDPWLEKMSVIESI